MRIEKANEIRFAAAELFSVQMKMIRLGALEAKGNVVFRLSEETIDQTKKKFIEAVLQLELAKEIE